jgi:hypothetical protein
MTHFVEPNAACFPSGSPRSIYTPGGFQLRQSPGYVVFLFDGAHNYRIVSTDGRPHVGGNLTLWQSDARSRWDDNALVVDIVNQNSWTCLDRQGRFGTASLHVIERFTRLDADILHVEATIEDASVCTQPWTIAFPVKRNKQRAESSREFTRRHGDEKRLGLQCAALSRDPHDRRVPESPALLVCYAH